MQDLISPLLSFSLPPLSLLSPSSLIYIQCVEAAAVLYVDPWQEDSSRKQEIHPIANCLNNMVVLRIVPCLCLLVGFSVQVDEKSGKEAGKAGNFMEDEQWLSTISQYGRKIKHWNRFRDVSGVFTVMIQACFCRKWCMRCCVWR